MSDIRQQRIDNLKAAARRKSQEKTAAAETAIRRLIKRGEPVTFQAVQREAGVSHAFLYKNQDLRARIEHQRARHRPTHTAAPAENTESNIVLALTDEITRLKKAHRDQIAALRRALEAAHGENLALRREIQRQGGPLLASSTPDLGH